MFGVLDPTIGHGPWDAIYKSYEELIKDLNKRMAEDGYKVVRARSHRSRVGGAELPTNEMVRVDLVCDRGGRPYQCHATKHKTTTKKTGCPWKAKAVKRKTLGGWVLTITCEQHNHEPGTPGALPVSDGGGVEEGEADADGELEPQDDSFADASRLDAETATVMAVAGVSRDALRLTGDTFQQFKQEYRRMSKPERFGVLSQLQLRIAAIYAVENEDMQRVIRQEVQNKRLERIERTKKQQLVGQNGRAHTRVASASSAAAAAAAVAVDAVAAAPAVLPPAPAAAALVSQAETPLVVTMAPQPLSIPSIIPRQQLQPQQPTQQQALMQQLPHPHPHHPVHHPQYQHPPHPHLQSQQTPMVVPVPPMPDFQQYTVPAMPLNGVLHPAKRLRGQNTVRK